MQLPATLTQLLPAGCAPKFLEVFEAWHVPRPPGDVGDEVQGVGGLGVQGGPGELQGYGLGLLLALWGADKGG